jgi:hypothetical protein
VSVGHIITAERAGNLTVTEIVNLRRARKAKARAEGEDVAAANRAKYGTAKAVRDLTKARSEKDTQTLESHRLDADKNRKN